MTAPIVAPNLVPTTSQTTSQFQDLPDPTDEPGKGLSNDQKKQLADDDNLMQILRGYKDEARLARQSGTEPREDVWRDNNDAFWMRRPELASQKQDWQAQERFPYVANFVERFTAAIRRAATEVPTWANVEDPKDKAGPGSRLATHFTRLLLDTSGTNATGQVRPFEQTFGNTVRCGCLMAMCSAVTWRDGRLRIEQVDPRSFYPDPTGRGLYRVRTFEKDKNQLLEMAEEVDAAGDPIYDVQKIKDEMIQIDFELQNNKSETTGGGVEENSARHPMQVDEYLATIIGDEGEALTKKRLVVVLNDRVIIRNEPNPFWHGQDWIVYHPLMQSPLGEVDGRTYVEDFRPIAHTVENATNMILDAVTMNSMNAYEVDPDVLDSPEQLNDGVHANVTFVRSPDADPERRAVTSIPLGRHLGPEAFQTVAALKQEMQEAGAQSDLSLGQTTSKGDTTATEIQTSTAGQNALTQSITSDIEDGYLAAIVMLSYYTGIQHLTPESHPEIIAELSPEQLDMLITQRQDFASRTMKFRAKGISAHLEKQQRLRSSLGALNVIGGNPLLLEEFKKEGLSIGKFVMSILEDLSVDIERISLTDEEKLAEQTQQNLARIQNEQGGAPGEGPTAGRGSVGGGGTAQNQGGPDPLATLAGGVDGGVIGG